MTVALPASSLAPIDGEDFDEEGDDSYAIMGRVRLPGVSRPPAMEVILNDDGASDGLSTLTRPDGSFEFAGIVPGVYTLDVINTKFVFGKYKVDVRPSGKVRALMWPYPGGPKKAMSHPLKVEPQAISRYFEPRPTVSIWTFLRNPMILMTMLPLGMMLCMRRMMDAMPEEERLEAQRQQAEMMKGALQVFSAGEQATRRARRHEHIKQVRRKILSFD